MNQPVQHRDKRRYAIAVIGLAALLGGCATEFDASKPLADGIYTAESSPDEQNARGIITITIAGGKIAEVQFSGVNSDGSAKDDTYGTDSRGQIANQEYYEKAQVAAAAFETYALDLLEVGNPDEVDAIAGATWAHDQFVEAAIAALEQAQAEH